jgi:hypothetical protein
MNQSDFQMISERQEQVAATNANDERWKLARGRALACEHQQAHRDREKKRKIENGWVPGEKPVRVFILSNKS